jgi:hypothetical protein
MGVEAFTGCLSDNLTPTSILVGYQQRLKLTHTVSPLCGVQISVSKQRLHMKERIEKFVCGLRGCTVQDLVDYVVILAVVSMVAMLAFKAHGTTVSTSLR